MDRQLILTLAIFSLIGYISATSVVCYHGTWSHYRTGNGKFSVSDTPANLCTHYIYTFFGLNSTSNEVISLDTWLDIDLGGLKDAVALKKNNTDLKVLFAVGGWNEGSLKYSNMVANESSRATFIASALKWAQNYGFDGVDIDWEYPGRRDSNNTDDKENFAFLVKELYEVFHPLNLSVTAAVSANSDFIDISYDVPVLSKYLSLIHVMTFDFHVASNNVTGHNAPLYSAQKFVGTEYEHYSVNASIHAWIERGACPSKLALAVPFYGRNAVLLDATNNTPGSASNGTGASAGPYTATSGFWGYNEIIEEFQDRNWTTAWDDEQQVPYAYLNTTWLSFDNPTSIALKIKYAQDLGLGGVMIWSIETDDFHGLNGTTFPLLKATNALESS